MVHFVESRRLRQSTDNPLIRVVEPFDQRTRRALYAAANRGPLRRRTWNGCALDRAAAVLEATVKSKRDATRVFNLRRRRVSDFLRVWDRLPGSDADCSALLREAILAVGLYDRTEPATGTPTERAERRAERVAPVDRERTPATDRKEVLAIR